MCKIEALLLLLSFLLVSSVKAITEVDLPNATSSDHTPTSSSASSLTLPIKLSPPWGPPEFDYDYRISSLPIPSEAVFMVALTALGQEAPFDFNGRLSAARVTYGNRQYPDFTIVVESTTPNRQVFRKHLFWMLASALPKMIHNGFFAASFSMIWRGTIRLGTVKFVAENPRARKALGVGADAGAGAEYQDRILNDTTSVLQRLSSISSHTVLTNVSANGTNNNEIEFHYTFGARLMNMQDIVMGSVGALIGLAEDPPNHVYTTFFVGHFSPRYHAYLVYNPLVHPSQLNKILLAGTIVETVFHAKSISNWHEVVTLVSFNGQVLARGAYGPELRSGGISQGRFERDHESN